MSEKYISFEENLQNERKNMVEAFMSYSSSYTRKDEQLKDEEKKLPILDEERRRNTAYENGLKKRSKVKLTIEIVLVAICFLSLVFIVKTGRLKLLWIQIPAALVILELMPGITDFLTDTIVKRKAYKKLTEAQKKSLDEQYAREKADFSARWDAHILEQKRFIDSLDSELDSRRKVHEAAVTNYCQSVIRREYVKPMAEHLTMSFRRGVDGADRSAAVKYIDVRLNYTVTNTAVTFQDDRGDTLPLLSYVFADENAPDLNSIEECEGLAQALAKRVVLNMKSVYSSSTMKIALRHTDAVVSLRFTDNNPNYGKF